MVNLSPIGRLIPTRDELNEGELQEFDRLVTVGAAVGLQGEEQRGKYIALTEGADGPKV